MRIQIPGKAEGSGLHRPRISGPRLPWRSEADRLRVCVETAVSLVKVTVGDARKNIDALIKRGGDWA